uniref:Uncharacterized protein n=1 Tax=Nelumbo nucifera TaxID=4432 RepID=A0A822ZR25_NELNU|nr:TPA_asm: hypothetical protein HUJ06_004191 [Nelumbo nucifera]
MPEPILPLYNNRRRLSSVVSLHSLFKFLVNFLVGLLQFKSQTSASTASGSGETDSANVNIAILAALVYCFARSNVTTDQQVLQLILHRISYLSAALVVGPLFSIFIPYAIVRWAMFLVYAMLFLPVLRLVLDQMQLCIYEKIAAVLSTTLQLLQRLWMGRGNNPLGFLGLTGDGMGVSWLPPL